MQLYQGNGWNDLIAGLTNPHILQTREWGQLKSGYGWQVLPQVWYDSQEKVCAAAMVLKRAVSGGFSVLYVPRGPLLATTTPELYQRVIDDLKTLARQERSIFIKIDPEIITGTGIPGAEDDRPILENDLLMQRMVHSGWHFSQDQVQFRNTVWLDLSGDEDAWLARMKQKTRYNLRLAQKKGVRIRTGTPDDLARLYRMYAETSVRDGFVIRSEEYYLRLWGLFMERGLAEPLIAEVDGEAVSGLILFLFGERAWYLYGMSLQAHREKMPNYLLQWEAMRHARARGCLVYDLWGAPDVFDESDTMWGVFRFKESLGGRVVRTGGAWDYPARPLLYRLYTRILPRILDVMRRRGKARTQQEVTL